MNELTALVRKEVLEIVGDRQSRHGSLVQAAVFVMLLGVFVPGVNARFWLNDDPSTVFFYVFLPGILAAGVASDAFAGERERHTLETLLATPLSEHVILAGKLFAAVVYGVTIAATALAVSVVTVNVGAGGYVPSVLLIAASLGASLASSVVMASVAIVVSMLVPVARVAHQLSWIGSVAVLSVGVAVWKWLAVTVSWRNVFFAEACVLVLGLLILEWARLLFRRERFFEVR